MAIKHFVAVLLLAQTVLAETVVKTTSFSETITEIDYTKLVDFDSKYDPSESLKSYSKMTGHVEYTKTTELTSTVHEMSNEELTKIVNDPSGKDDLYYDIVSSNFQQIETNQRAKDITVKYVIYRKTRSALNSVETMCKALKKTKTESEMQYEQFENSIICTKQDLIDAQDIQDDAAEDMAVIRVNISIARTKLSQAKHQSTKFQKRLDSLKLGETRLEGKLQKLQLEVTHEEERNSEKIADQIDLCTDQVYLNVTIEKLQAVRIDIQRAKLDLAESRACEQESSVLMKSLEATYETRKASAFDAGKKYKLISTCIKKTTEIEKKFKAVKKQTSDLYEECHSNEKNLGKQVSDAIEKVVVANTDALKKLKKQKQKLDEKYN